MNNITLCLCLFAAFITLSYTLPTASLPYVCTSWGDPHITTFPGGRTDLNFPGLQAPGDYYLAFFGTEPTKVIESHQPYIANPAVYVNYRVAVVDGGHIVSVNFDIIKIDGNVVVITGTVVVSPTMSITKNGYGYYTVNVQYGYINVLGINDQYQNIKIVVFGGPEPVGGLCAKDGYGGAPNDFGHHWQVPFPCNPFLYQTINEYNKNNPTDYVSSNGHWTTDDQVLLAAANQGCTPLRTDPVCARIVNPDPWFQSCLDDVIATKEPKFAESAVAAYRAHCAAVQGQGTPPSG